MKGIILAAGNGTRLFPASEPVSKSLLPVYDKPMIYYPLSTLMLADIKEIMIITNETDLENFKRLLGNGSQFGIHIEYVVQHIQRGIADAFIIAEEFISGDDVCLILGDNIFYHENLPGILKKASSENTKATIFAYTVKDPERFGVVEFDDLGNAVSLEEKPSKPRSNHAVVGLYIYDSGVSKIAKELKPSERGELEITDLNRKYLEKGDLKVVSFDENLLWVDTGTFDSLLDAGILVRSVQKKLGRPISCPERIAAESHLISSEELRKRIASKAMNEYYKYVAGLLDNR